MKKKVSGGKAKARTGAGKQPAKKRAEKPAKKTARRTRKAPAGRRARAPGRTRVPVALAKDVMTGHVVTVRPGTSVRELLELLRGTQWSGFPVVDDQGRPCGLVSQNDVLRALAAGTGASLEASRRKAALRLTDRAQTGGDALLALPVSELMSTPVISCAPGTPLPEVCRAMVHHRVHRVLVVEADRVVGLVSATDVVRLLAG